MKQDLDNVFEKIIEGEARRYTVLQVGEKIERHPSHFKGMKEMYQKEWNSLLNPNNVFIPYILVSIEAVLRQIIEIKKGDKKQPTATQILERLLNKKSPIVTVEADFQIIFGEKIDGSTKYYPKGCISKNISVEEAKKLILENEWIEESKLIIEKRDRNGYISNLQRILFELKEKYYSKQEKYGNNSYRNIILHANRLLIIEDGNLFAQILEDYERLINSVWGDAIMPYETDQAKNQWML
jgi:hypothetical protein